MQELIVATKNQGKLREIRELLKGLPFKVTSLADYPSAPAIIEDGKTFADNAKKKALVIAKFTNKLVLGEDSGLEVKALGNCPGVYSARFAGAGATDADNNKKLILELTGVPFSKRGARYRCFAALAQGKKIIGIVDGSCSGYITDKGRGTNGFGYDPYFLIQRYKKTFGELPPEIKAKISHRARAIRKMRAMLKRLF